MWISLSLYSLWNFNLWISLICTFHTSKHSKYIVFNLLLTYMYMYVILFLLSLYIRSYTYNVTANSKPHKLRTRTLKHSPPTVLRLRSPVASWRLFSIAIDTFTPPTFPPIRRTDKLNVQKYQRIMTKRIENDDKC